MTKVLKVYTVYDVAAEGYLQPFFMPSTGQAIRAFKDCVADPEHQFGRHPEDYTLFELGEFDVQKGKFTLLDAPYSYGTGVEHLPKVA